MDDQPEILHRRRERLRYRSHHRGTKEMDLLLGSFADRHIHDFGVAELDDYENLLAEPDPDLYEWLTGKTRPESNKLTGVMQMFLRHKIV